MSQSDDEDDPYDAVDKIPDDIDETDIDDDGGLNRESDTATDDEAIPMPGRTVDDEHIRGYAEGYGPDERPGKFDDLIGSWHQHDMEIYHAIESLEESGKYVASTIHIDLEDVQ